MSYLSVCCVIWNSELWSYQFVLISLWRFLVHGILVVMHRVIYWSAILLNVTTVWFYAFITYVIKFSVHNNIIVSFDNMSYWRRCQRNINWTPSITFYINKFPVKQQLHSTGNNSSGTATFSSELLMRAISEVRVNITSDGYRLYFTRPWYGNSLSHSWNIHDIHWMTLSMSKTFYW